MTSLTARYYSLIAIFLGVGLLVAGLALDRDSARMATRSLEEEGRRELALLRLSAPLADIARGNIPAVDAWCDRAGAAIGRRVTVIDSTGRVLGDSEVPLDSVPLMENHSGRSEVKAALEKGLGEARRQSWTIRRQLFYIAEPLAPSAARRTGPQAVLRISLPLQQATEFARRWQRHLWMAVGAVFLAVLAAGYLLGTRIDRRLRAMRRSAESLGQGDLATRIPVDAHDELGALARVLNSMAERLDSKLSELRAERNLSEAVIGNLSEGVALLAPDLTILHANERFWRLVGAERPAVPAPRLAAARQPVLEEIVREAMRHGTAIRREAALYVEDRRDHEVAVAPVREGSETGDWLLTIRDLKPERVMATLRREFVANVSHELKTPLTSIHGYAETLLQGGLEDEANRRRFVETIRSQAVRLEAIVEDLLELADLDRPDAALDVKDWDLASVVRDMASGFEELAARRGLSLDLEIRPGLRARFDRKRIEVALRNMLDNAIKYTDSGRVRIFAETGPSTIRVSVADTGRGIETQHLSRVFERFYRADHGRSRAMGGTGLGLSIVKHAVELHGGRVGVESAPGRGSTFWFEVPANGPGPPQYPAPGTSS
ncbi:MAG TPA: ATP-binding protein [Candidatus Eisenbacteria bacterium]